MQRIKLHAREPHFLGIINVSTYALFAAYTAVATVNTDINPCLIAAEPQPPRRNREGLQCQLTLPRPFHLLLPLDPKRTQAINELLLLCSNFSSLPFSKAETKAILLLLLACSVKPPSFFLSPFRSAISFFLFHATQTRGSLTQTKPRKEGEKRTLSPSFASPCSLLMVCV